MSENDEVRRSRIRFADDHPSVRVEKVRPAYQQVADQLRDMILQGQVLAGERLPIESELAVMFGVSRSTVREALRVLSSQNLVVTSRGVGGGTFVAHPEPGFVTDFLEATFGLLSGSEHLSVESLVEARELLEVSAAGLTALRRTAEHLVTLRSCLPEGSEDVSRAHLFEGNIQFHITIVEASGNVLLPVITRPIFSVLRTRFLRDAAPQHFWKGVARDHARILEAIEAGDQEAARLEMARHLKNLRPTYEAIDIRARGNDSKLGKGTAAAGDEM